MLNHKQQQQTTGNLSVENSAQVLEIADSSCADYLKGQVLSFMARNAAAVIETDDFKDLSQSLMYDAVRAIVRCSGGGYSKKTNNNNNNNSSRSNTPSHSRRLKRNRQNASNSSNSNADKRSRHQNNNNNNNTASAAASAASPSSMRSPRSASSSSGSGGGSGGPATTNQ
jgi:hypothetical protein